MARLTLDRLRRALRDAPPAPAYYVHGNEGILKDDAVALILDRALEPGTRDFNLDAFSAQQLDPAELAGACATMPMMAPRRAVILRDVEAWKRKSKAKQPALAYLDRPMPETVLVMVQGNDDDPDADLAGRCVSVECMAPTGEQLEAWLDDQLRAQGVSVAADGREHLLRATNGDLGLLSAEVQKLGGLAGDGVIDGDTVGALVGVRFGETVDDWRDTVLRDQTRQALELVPKLLELSGVSGVKMATQLGSSLLALAWARATAERLRLRDAALAARVKQELLFQVRPGVGSYDPFARLVAEVVGRWPLPRINAAVSTVLRADVSLKNTTISDDSGIVTDLVLTLAASRTRKAA